MKKIAFYDAKQYDRVSFDKANALRKEPFQIQYYDFKLNEKTASLAAGADAVCAFVNDDINAAAIRRLHEGGVKLIALRCAGYSNVDFEEAFGKIHVVRVPAYSPYAVAEHALALLLSLNRRIHKAYNRTRDFNFSLQGLEGMDLHGKTMGVVGTGKIGQVFINICNGIGMRVLAYDPFPAADLPAEYVTLEELFAQSDVISLHCPLTPQTRHIIDTDAIARMKEGVIIINTSRGALIESQALLQGLKSHKIGSAGLDVYEEEAEYFFEDHSSSGVADDTLALLSALPNVIITSHQAFLTREALQNIADTTLENVETFFSGGIRNEICYNCQNGQDPKTCRKNRQKPCF